MSEQQPLSVDDLIQFADDIAKRVYALKIAISWLPPGTMTGTGPKPSDDPIPVRYFDCGPKLRPPSESV
jgi:hypothetical protein